MKITKSLSDVNILKIPNVNVRISKSMSNVKISKGPILNVKISKVPMSKVKIQSIRVLIVLINIGAAFQS